MYSLSMRQAHYLRPQCESGGSRVSCKVSCGYAKRAGTAEHWPPREAPTCSQSPTQPEWPSAAFIQSRTR